MKVLAFLFLSMMLNSQAQERPYHLVTCFSESDGWIEILINKQQHNDQMLRVYSQAGLGPNSLEASYVSVGTNNSFSINENNQIRIIANYTAGLKLQAEYSVAELSANLNVQPIVYRNCRIQ